MKKHLQTRHLFVPIATLASVISPFVTCAIGLNLSMATSYKMKFIYLINQIVLPVIVSIAFITFVWGIYSYFIAGGASPDKRGEGAKFIMYGVIGFAIIFSVWGLVALFSNFFGLGGYSAPTYPTL